MPKRYQTIRTLQISGVFEIFEIIERALLFFGTIFFSSTTEAEHGETRENGESRAFLCYLSASERRRYYAGVYR